MLEEERGGEEEVGGRGMGGERGEREEDEGERRMGARRGNEESKGGGRSRKKRVKVGMRRRSGGREKGEEGGEGETAGPSEARTIREARRLLTVSPETRAIRNHLFGAPDVSHYQDQGVYSSSRVSAGEGKMVNERLQATSVFLLCFRCEEGKSPL